MNITTLKQIGNEWIKGDMHRIYFDAAKAYGMEFEYYGTGSIKTAYLNGEKISNYKSQKLFSRLPEKFFYDVKTKRFGAKGCDQETFDELVDALKAEVKKIEAIEAVEAVENKQSAVVLNDTQSVVVYVIKNSDLDSDVSKIFRNFMCNEIKLDEFKKEIFMRFWIKLSDQQVNDIYNFLKYDFKSLDEKEIAFRCLK